MIMDYPFSVISPFYPSPYNSLIQAQIFLSRPLLISAVCCSREKRYLTGILLAISKTKFPRNPTTTLAVNCYKYYEEGT